MYVREMKVIIGLFFFFFHSTGNSHKKLWVIVNVRNSGKISLLISFSFGRPITIYIFLSLYPVLLFL